MLIETQPLLNDKFINPIFFQKPAYTIEYEERNFNPELMVRVGEKDRRMRGGSDMDETDYGRREGNRVSTYIWPGLREQNGQLVYKAVVVTK